MENNKLTIFQKINQALSTNNVRKELPYDVTSPVQSQLLTANNIEDYNTKKLELNQNDYINSQYESVRKTVYQDNLYYETSRLTSYIDFEAMEYFPEIAAALDIYAEESTPLNEKGKVLGIYSESERVKGILEDLFYKTLDINTNLPSWSRNLAKYGDNFLYLKTELNKGITGVIQLKNIEIARKEITQFDEDTNKGVTFEWQAKNLQFSNFQIAHFRRVDDDRKLPYGTSILEKCRKIFKQLSLLEDAVLIYRITRAPERRVFKINVGNTDDKDVDSLVAKIAQKFKKSSLINSQNGQIDYRTATLSTDMDYFVPTRDGNQGTVIDTLPGACLSLDTKIELLDGRSLSLSDIISEHEEGKSLWAYSINPKDGEIVPGKITWAGVTRKDAKVIKLTLDNGESLIVTPDHKIFSRNKKTLLKAEELEIGDSLWSFNEKLNTINSTEKTKYHMVYDHSLQKYVYTHRMVRNFLNNIDKNNDFVYKLNHEKKNVIHHLDHNPLNNNPENLVMMSWKDHFLYHSENNIWTNSKDILSLKKYYSQLLSKRNNILWKDNEYVIKMSEMRKNLWRNENYRNKTKEAQKNYINTNFKKLDYDFKLLKCIVDLLKENISRKNMVTILNNNEIFLKLWISCKNNTYNYKGETKITARNIDSILKYFNYKNITSLKNNLNEVNHTVVSIEYLNDTIDTGTITIDGGEKYHNYHNFALTCGVFVNNSNLGEISDLTFFQNKLFAALRVPKSFLNFEAAAGDGKSLALQDIRFLQPINRIQQSIIQELNKIAIIHLMILGFEDDLDNFKLTLGTPSIQADILRLEQLNTKLDAYVKAVSPVDGGFAAYSMTKGMKEILNMTDDEIMLNIRQQRFEKIAMLENDSENLKTQYLKTGIFDLMDQKFASTKPLAPNAEDVSGGGGGPSGGGGGMPDLGGSDIPSDTELPGDAELPNNFDDGDIPVEVSNTEEPISEFKNILINNNLDIINEAINNKLKFIDDLLR